MDERSLYETIGGEQTIAALVNRFYEVMDSDPAAAPIRHMHPDDLTTSKLHLTWFLTGWLGGPQLYIERRGHPRLRARHLPFTIGAAERDQWVHCARIALAEHVADEAARAAIDSALARLADNMRNQPDGG